ncbi:MAG: SDR family oxidoreductase [Dehalococcoidia bacterium]|nr:SDR family oxidoreductase [Dehalococcoidia bacterium]
MYNSLKNNQALIIGGTKGIGKAIALRLASEGVNLLINYHSSDDLAEQTADECKKSGVQVELIKADISATNGIDVITQKIDSMSRLDILILNAAKGLERPRMAIEQKSGHIQSTLDTNLIAPWEIIKSSSKIMKKNSQGSIVGLLTPGTKFYIEGYSAVAISKGAFEALIKYTAVELAGYNIQVNGVMAGLVEETVGSKSFDKILNKIKNVIPAGRNVHTEDVANLVIWLCSDQSNMIIGQNINVDGGFSLASWKTLQD